MLLTRMEIFLFVLLLTLFFFSVLFFFFAFFFFFFFVLGSKVFCSERLCNLLVWGYRNAVSKCWLAVTHTQQSGLITTSRRPFVIDLPGGSTTGGWEFPFCTRVSTDKSPVVFFLGSSFCFFGFWGGEQPCRGESGKGNQIVSSTIVAFGLIRKMWVTFFWLCMDWR
ncbi:hypothetical protein BP00DRAFT_259416 [Aspergillus indologenus CBS 114.80]|uniref:Uncharacterized protein n=1 Tax=Aspergillus indologenus CBS 114.80 TaxID=1450541 RepID=A0A2V5HVE2_9EURO|nr:hypothetical protein BP00DRAFT_259416 [Aspergillus indologenus CBS 114.80]